jgi:hypothetical protein
MALETELKTYERESPNLTAHEGRYALVHGDRVEDIFQAYEDALKAGYERFGLAPFLVKQIHAAEVAHYFTRDVVPPCRT